MKETKRSFNPKALNSKNIKIIISLLVIFLGLLAFIVLRDTDPLITHTQANKLFTENKIEKIIVDGEYIRLKTAQNRYKIYKDAINKTAFFTKYPVEVKEEGTSVYDICLCLFWQVLFGFCSDS